MTDLKTILEAAGITEVLVVDDAYDPIPQASDLLIDNEEWVQLFDDLSKNDEATLVELFPEYDMTPADELRSSDRFVKVLWENRERFTKDLLDPLFLRYEIDGAEDMRYLGSLLEHLRALGLTCATSGRDFVKKAATAHLLFVDLFLNSAQRQNDINLSIEGVAEVISSRKNDHPLVVLMSRSNRLPEKRVEFQERAALFESNFRIARKGDLVENAAVSQLLIRLATHFPDSKKLLSFVNAWEAGLTNARDRTMKLIRKIGLSDIAQIDQLLLSAEGEPTGSYLVDIFDKVLQHEIEREQAIIDAATALNSLANESYPPPFVPGDKDLQDLVHRFLFQNRARLKLAGTQGTNIAFGDVLRRRIPPPQQIDGVNPFKCLLASIDDFHVLSVLTPACDLQRQGAKRILLLVGKLSPLTAASWTYRNEGAKTPVVELANGDRFWIKWDLKHIETLAHNELQHFLSIEHGELEVVARLRESHAIELQQKLLANLGRVGLAAPMPATFHMHVEAFLPDSLARLVRLDIPVLDDGGVCFIGRSEDAGKSQERLLLTENACDAIFESLRTVDTANVHERTRALIGEIRETGDLLQALGRGLALPPINQPQAFKEIITSGEKVVGLIKRSRIANQDELPSKYLPKAGIILAVFNPADAEDAPGVIPELPNVAAS